MTTRDAAAVKVPPVYFGPHALLGIVGGTRANLQGYDLVEQREPNGLHRDPGLYLRVDDSAWRTNEFCRIHPTGDFSVPVLPVPFTVEEFREFCGVDVLFADDWIDVPFINDDGSLDAEALDGLKRTNLAAARLVGQYLGVSGEQAERAASRDESGDDLADPAATVPVDQGLRSAAAEPAVATLVHRIAPRKNTLTQVIEDACKAAGSDAIALVWNHLVGMAKSTHPPPPLVGYVEAEGVQYRHDSDQGLLYLTRGALEQRLRRRRKSRNAQRGIQQAIG